MTRHRNNFLTSTDTVNDRASPSLDNLTAQSQNRKTVLYRVLLVNTASYNNQAWYPIYLHLRTLIRTNVTQTKKVCPITFLAFFLVEFHPSFTLFYSSYTTTYFPWFMFLSLKFSFMLFSFSYFSSAFLCSFWQQHKPAPRLLHFLFPFLFPYFSLQFLLF